MRFLPLQEFPALVPLVAQWHHAEWQALYPGKSLAGFEHDLRTPAGADGLPQTWLLLDGDEVAGTASLLVHDMTTNRDLSPWLANIYVPPGRRGRGLGGLLVRNAMREAQARGIRQLYLFTEDQQPFYERLGWRLLRTEPCSGTPVAIMTCDLPVDTGLVPAAPDL